MKIKKRIFKVIVPLFLKYISKNTGEKWMQVFFEEIFRIGLKGMNYGPGADFKESGEFFAMTYILQKTNDVQNRIIFDVGANVGGYTLVLDKVFNKKRVIYCFEPSLNTFNLLVKNTSGFRNIVVSNFGFSETASTNILYSDSSRSGLASVYNRRLKHHGITMDKKEEISLDTIDNYCEEQGIKKIHFLKLDIEGHELSALHGAKKMMANGNICFIQFEFGGCNIDSATHFQDFYYLLQDKYHIYRILKDGLKEIRHYSEIHEIFLTTNYLAELISTENS